MEYGAHITLLTDPLYPPGYETHPWEGAYADEHVVVQRLTFAQLWKGARLSDSDIVDSSVESYLRHGAVIAVDKRCVSGKLYRVGHGGQG